MKIIIMLHWPPSSLNFHSRYRNTPNIAAAPGQHRTEWQQTHSDTSRALGEDS